MKVEVYCDGSALHDRMGIGVAVFSGPTCTYKIVRRLGPGTNNQAEYRALIAALKYCLENHSEDDITVYMDSQLVVRQITGEYTVRNEALQPLKEEALSLLGSLKSVSIRWIPEKLNKAHRLAYEASH